MVLTNAYRCRVASPCPSNRPPHVRRIPVTHIRVTVVHVHYVPYMLNGHSLPLAKRQAHYSTHSHYCPASFKGHTPSSVS
jgi:hypothetical protein